MIRESWNAIIVEIELAFLELRSGSISTWQDLREAFLLPGEYMVVVLREYVPALADNPAFGVATHGDTYALVISVVAWLCLLLAILRILRSVGRTLVDGYYTVRRAVVRTSRFPRSLRLRLTASLAALRRRRLAGRCYSEEFSIDSLQMAVMDAQGRLPPGHVATAVDIAGDLGLRPRPVEHALEGLRKLHLVQVAFGTCEGYPGYSLTRPGQVFLATCTAGRRKPAIGADVEDSIRIIRPRPFPARTSPGPARPI